MADFRHSGLWQAAFKPRKNDPFEAQRNRLATAYLTFWERANRLAQRIAGDLPGLTLHDEHHLNALWDSASQLTGEAYPINPLETFVFGGAVLLHDTGHAIAAYEGGLAELKNAPEYRDAVASLLRNSGSIAPSEKEISNPPENVAAKALFAALRRLHSRQAEVLVKRRFRDSYLIDDSDIRDNLAELIGRVAASHHWDRYLLDRLPKVQGPPGFLPGEWSIEPVKIACLLRCADAIQIDQRRTPAFARAVQSPEGVSEFHWQAQQLGQPVVDQDVAGVPGTLIFTSQTDFTEEQADAWWIAYDLIRNANEELQYCYELMRDAELPAFTVARIAGAEGPSQLKKFVRTSGWRPINAEVKVSSVEQIIQLIGGPFLYGLDPSVPLRELIQNASDAVRARRVVANDPLYEGRIIVRLKPSVTTDAWQLIVEDDGIGMSESTLTGPLLEFGKSFWASDEIQDEFPGLVSSNIRQRGRYGIGFFSTLMISRQVEVISRRWDAAHDQTRRLTFRDGLRLRPLISEVKTGTLGSLSTRISLSIKKRDAERLLTVTETPECRFGISLSELVAHLCPCLDCDVWVSSTDGPPSLAHSRKWYESDALRWLREISFADRRANEILDSYLALIAPNIRVIEGPDHEPCGRAAIGFGRVDVGIESIGGLVSSRHSRAIGNFSMSFAGAIDYEPNGPQRGTGSLTNPSGVATWLTEQVRILAASPIAEFERYLASMNIAAFGGDPTCVATILVNRKAVSLNAVYELLAAGKEIFVVVGQGGTYGPSIFMVQYWPTHYLSISLGWEELDYAVDTIEAWKGAQYPDQIYHKIPTIEEPADQSFLSCLQRYSLSKDRALIMEPVKDVLFARFKGEASPREKLTPGMELRGDAIKLTLA